MSQTPWMIFPLVGLLWIAPAVAQDSPTTAPNTQQREIQDPQQLIQGVMDKVLARLQGHQEEMRRDSHRIYALVEELILPHFDFERMSRWVLGRYWNDATPVQQAHFVEQFRNLLVRTYGVALLDYTDEKIQFLPSRGDPARGESTVRINIRHRGNVISIDSNLYLKDTAWKVYDVIINGVSLVANYRNSFATEIRNNGMDGLINRLTDRNQGKEEKSG
ncbi:phospholipid transport system substrate-binding protein [Gammaproteobacteria bacterium]